MNAKKRVLATAVGAAMLGAAGLAQAGVISQAVFVVDNVIFGGWDATSETVTAFPDGFTLVSASNDGDTKVSLDSASDSDTADVPITAGDPIGAFSLTTCVGDCAAYSPTTAVVLPPTDTYSGSFAAIAAGTVAGVSSSLDDTVSLQDPGVGSAQSNTGLSAEFTFTIDSEGQLAISFDAEFLLYAGLDPDTAVGSKAAPGISWTMTITDNSDGSEVFSWTPDGAAGGITGGTEVLDEEDLTRGFSRLSEGVTSTGLLEGSFLAYTNTLVAGTYTLSLVQTAKSDATFIPKVPVPAPMALMGLGLLGMGVTLRRRRKA